MPAEFGVVFVVYRTMVMEPSPQCVGREFVKQYYTMLNQAPNFLHRHVLCCVVSACSTVLVALFSVYWNLNSRVKLFL